MNRFPSEKVFKFIRSERVAQAAEATGRAVMAVTLVAALSEAAAHAEQVCEAVQDTSAIVVTELTGEVPSWASPRTDPISQEVMFGGPDNIQPFHPESCLPAFMLQNS